MTMEFGKSFPKRVWVGGPGGIPVILNADGTAIADINLIETTLAGLPIGGGDPHGAAICWLILCEMKRQEREKAASKETD